MTENTIWDLDGPLFEGRRPFLVVPAAIILVLALTYGPARKTRSQKPWYDSVLIQAWPLIVTEVVNLLLVTLMYIYHDDSPLTTETRSAAMSPTIVVGARLVTFSIIWAAITTSFAQIGILPIYFRELSDHKALSKAMLFPAVAGLVWTLTSFLTFDYFWPWRTFTEHLMRGLIPAYIFLLSFDTSLYAELQRLRRTASPARKPTVDRLARAAEVTFALSFACMMLVPVGVIAGVPPKGWFTAALGLCGYLTIAHAHVVTFFVMWRAIEDEAEIEGSISSIEKEDQDVDVKVDLKE